MTNTKVLYGIDRNAKNISSDIKLVTIDDDISDVDAIVVTVMGMFDEVFDVLSKKINCPIISIEDILNEV